MNNGIQSMVLSLILCTMVRCDQYLDGTLLIDRLNQFFRFDHHFFLMDSAVDLNRWFPKHDYVTPKTIFTFNDLPDITKQAVLQSITSKNTFLIVVVESSNLVNGSELFDQVKTVRKRFVDVNVNLKIGVFFVCNINALDAVEELFRSSWSVGIVNLFSAFYLNTDDGDTSFNVFKYNPFGTFDLVNVTKSESPNDYFPDKVPNYSKDSLRFALNDEFPLRAIQIKLWDTVLSITNASMSKVKVVASNSTWLGVDIFYHQVEMHSGRLEGLYPHHQVISTMIVPHAQQYPGVVAYLQNGTWTLLFVCAIFVIVMSSLMLMLSGYFYQKKILPLQCVVDVVNLIINDNACIKYQNLYPAHVFVIVPLTFTGLIVMNGIFSLFQSFITSPIYQNQINSIQDIYMSPFPILCDERTKQDYVKLLEDVSKSDGWEAKVHGTTNHRQLEHNVWTFNNSIAFFAFDNEANTLIDLQKRLGFESYHMLSDVFLGKSLVGFLVRPDFPFTELINGILHRLNGAGLIERWLKEHNDYYLRAQWKFSRHLQITNKADVDVFDMTVIWCGCIASVIVFICEIVWSNVCATKCKMLKRNFRFGLRGKHHFDK